MNEWIEELSDISASGERAVLVTIARIRGSAPRETGAKMIVTETETVGTIGGGQLEYQCTRIAVGMLDDAEGAALQTFSLGSDMGQCCGGVVDVLFEPICTRLPHWLTELRATHGQRLPAVLVTELAEGERYGKRVASGAEADALLGDKRDARIEDGRFYEPIIASDMHIAVFGAGHVGSAVVNALSALDCNIRWVDNRRNVFRHIPVNVRAIETESPALEVAAMPSGSSFLVMTHSHSLDFEICDRILRRGDALYCGLIGSITKRRRFEKRFRQQGLAQGVIDKLICPIGVDGISGKKPAEIAVAAAAEILQVYEAASGARQVDYPDNVRPLRP